MDCVFYQDDQEEIIDNMFHLKLPMTYESLLTSQYMHNIIYNFFMKHDIYGGAESGDPCRIL